jgi:D-alanyl-D-alanine carboxypeptidase
LGGELLREDLLSVMTRTSETSEDWGLGLFRADLSCGAAWGHGGLEPAYSTMALAARDGSKIVVVAKNAFAFESVKAVAEEMYCS